MNRRLAIDGEAQSFDAYIRRLPAEKLAEAKAMTRSALVKRVVELEVKQANLLRTLQLIDRNVKVLDNGMKDVYAISEEVFDELASDHKERSKGGKIRHKGTAKIKEEAYKIWKDWQAGKCRDIGHSQAAFGRYIEDKYKDGETTITARQVETKWCPKWRKMQSAT